MTQTPKTRKALILRNFKDAGTGQRFTADAVEQLEDGVFRNYEAAGLVRAAPAEDGKAKPAA